MKLTPEQKKMTDFHLTVINFHDQVIKNFVNHIAKKAGIKGEVSYDLTKGEIYESKPKKHKNKSR